MWLRLLEGWEMKIELNVQLNKYIYICMCCYRWSWFEARSKICSAERQANLRGKNKVKFRTSSQRISLVCNILGYCEGVDFRVTGVKFMTGLQLYCCSVSLGTVYSTNDIPPGNPGPWYPLVQWHLKPPHKTPQEHSTYSCITDPEV